MEQVLLLVVHIIFPHAIAKSVEPFQPFRIPGESFKAFEIQYTKVLQHKVITIGKLSEHKTFHSASKEKMLNIEKKKKT